LEKAVDALGKQAAGLPVIMCGMIGSAQGWQDAGYLTKTADIHALAEAALPLTLPNRKIWIIPGVHSASFAGVSDVMRGEETALAGVISRDKITDGLFCLPGTHSKWVSVKGGAITSLSSFMTGELFDITSKYSIIQPLLVENEAVSPHEDSFIQGLDLARKSLGFMHQLFAIRAGVLTGSYAASGAKSLLSGLCIGTELVQAEQIIAHHHLPVYLNAAGAMADFYQAAFQHFKIDNQAIDGAQASLSGLFAIGQKILASEPSHNIG